MFHLSGQWRQDSGMHNSNHHYEDHLNIFLDSGGPHSQKRATGGQPITQRLPGYGTEPTTKWQSASTQFTDHEQWVTLQMLHVPYLGNRSWVSQAKTCHITYHLRSFSGRCQGLTCGSFIKGPYIEWDHLSHIVHLLRLAAALTRLMFYTSPPTCEPLTGDAKDSIKVTALTASGLHINNMKIIQLTGLQPG